MKILTGQHHRLEDFDILFNKLIGVRKFFHREGVPFRKRQEVVGVVITAEHLFELEQLLPNASICQRSAV